MKRLIQNAQILMDHQLQNLDILFDEQEILQTAGWGVIQPDSDTEVQDASGLVILPGLIDTHVHLREPGYTEKETIKDGTRAAARGGFTEIFAMPNVLPFPSTVEAMEAYLKKIDEDACIRVHPFGTITNNEAGMEPTNYQTLKKLGIHWFSDDGVGVQSKDVMEQAMQQAKEADVLFSCHTEDMNYRKPGASVHESDVFANTGWIGIPSACESEQLKRDLDLALEAGIRYHADHISAKESVEYLKEAKEKGADVSAEVTAHHLLLCDEDVKGPNWKMNPPLRSKEDRQALIEGLESGALDFIANDHAPHTFEEKSRPMDKAPFGIVSLETAFELLYTEFVSRKRRWSLPQLVEWMAEKPAKRFGLEKSGSIQPGHYPDLVLINVSEGHVIDPNKFYSKGKNTPFAGWYSDCEIVETICAGKTVYKKGNEQ